MNTAAILNQKTKLNQNVIGLFQQKRAFCGFLHQTYISALISVEIKAIRKKTPPIRMTEDWPLTQEQEGFEHTISGYLRVIVLIFLHLDLSLCGRLVWHSKEMQNSKAAKCLPLLHNLCPVRNCSLPIKYGQILALTCSCHQIFVGSSEGQHMERGTSQETCAPL